MSNSFSVHRCWVPISQSSVSCQPANGGGRQQTCTRSQRAYQDTDEARCRGHWTWPKMVWGNEVIRQRWIKGVAHVFLNWIHKYTVDDVVAILREQLNLGWPLAMEISLDGKSVTLTMVVMSKVKAGFQWLESRFFMTRLDSSHFIKILICALTRLFESLRMTRTKSYDI